MLTQTAATPVNNPNENKDDLSSEDIQKLTSELKDEIDQEIKKQFAENQSLEHAQEKVTELLTSHEQLKTDEKPTPEAAVEKPKETPGIGEILANPDNLGNEDAHLDPLRSSVENAISSLKEGDTISKDWVLKKVLTTSFGNNKSSFYELENRAGAHWTLSPEEMKEVLRAEILSQKGSPDETTEKAKTDIPNLSPEKTADDGPPLNKDSRVESPEDGLTEKKSEEKDKQEKVEEVIFQAKEKENDSKDIDLTKEQIDLITKLHNDKNSWSTFTSFSPSLWEKVYDLYKSGKLVEIGIEAHPLLDQIEKTSFGNPVQIEKGTSIAKLLTENGYNLNWSKDDALLLGCHILANYNTLNEAIKKVEQSGIAVSPLESKKDIINLIVAANNSNAEALHSLQENLRFLPVNEKFKVIKPDDLDALKKFI